MNAEYDSVAEVISAPRARQLRDSSALPSDFDTSPSRARQLRDSFDLLSPADLATLLDRDERTLAVWRSQLRGPDFIKLGRTIFYRRTDVITWIDHNTKQTDRAA